MTLAELLTTPAHAAALARGLAVTVSVFDAERTTDGALPVVELLTALLWELAQQATSCQMSQDFLLPDPAPSQLPCP